MSPPIPRPLAAATPTRARRGRPSRRADIYAAALRLFRRNGFHATSINDIGDEAGVAGTAVYSHFSTKQGVLAEAIRDGASRIADGIRPVLGREGSSEEAALEDLVRAYVRVVLENADLNACYVLESRNLDTDVAAPLRRKERLLRSAWQERLLRVRPELTADEAMAMVQMAIFSVLALCVHRNKIDPDALQAQAVAFVLGALRGPVVTPQD